MMVPTWLRRDGKLWRDDSARLLSRRTRRAAVAAARRGGRLRLLLRRPSGRARDNPLLSPNDPNDLVCDT